MRLYFLVSLVLLATSCSVRLSEKHYLQCAPETSGLAVSDNDTTLFTVEDSGNGPVVRRINKKGEMVSYSIFPERTNVDWEEMANDSDAYFIGDIGNNMRNRDTLTIDKQFFDSPFDGMMETQFLCDHPLAPFNFEAMFYVNDSMYLITKKHGEKYTYLFRVEINNELNKITPIDSARIRGQITGADYNAENNLLIMTGYRWYIPFVIINRNATPSKALCKPFRRKTFWFRPALQTEAVVIVSPDEIYVSAEGNQLHNPAFFRLKVKK